MQVRLTSCRLDVNDLGCEVSLNWLIFIVLDDDRNFVVVVLNVLSYVIEVIVVWSEATGECIGRHLARFQGVAR